MAVQVRDTGGSGDYRGSGHAALGSEGITARTLAPLRAVNGLDVPITPDTLAPIDHFRGEGVVAIEEPAAVL